MQIYKILNQERYYGQEQEECLDPHIYRTISGYGRKQRTDHSEEDRYECKDQDKDDSGTSGLSNGLGTLYGKFPSAVCREFFFKDPEACKGEDKRKQCAQKDDHVPHLVICHYLENHILTPEE